LVLRENDRLVAFLRSGASGRSKRGARVSKFVRKIIAPATVTGSGPRLAS
jgi:hypothetical protein